MTCSVEYYLHTYKFRIAEIFTIGEVKCVRAETFSASRRDYAPSYFSNMSMVTRDEQLESRRSAFCRVVPVERESWVVCQNGRTTYNAIKKLLLLPIKRFGKEKIMRTETCTSKVSIAAAKSIDTSAYLFYYSIHLLTKLNASILKLDGIETKRRV